MEIQRLRKFEMDSFYPSEMGEPEHHVKNEFSMVMHVGDRIFMRGQTVFDLEGNFHGEGSPAEQADTACRCIKHLLEEAGASLDDVCKRTTYVTDRKYRNEGYGVIAEHFDGIYPCSTGLVIDGLAMPEMLVEIDVEAVVSR